MATALYRFITSAELDACEFDDDIGKFGMFIAPDTGRLFILYGGNFVKVDADWDDKMVERVATYLHRIDFQPNLYNRARMYALARQILTAVYEPLGSKIKAETH
jgi:hypothetical protein